VRTAGTHKIINIHSDAVGSYSVYVHEFSYTGSDHILSGVVKCWFQACCISCQTQQTDATAKWGSEEYVKSNDEKSAMETDY